MTTWKKYSGVLIFVALIVGYIGLLRFDLLSTRPTEEAATLQGFLNTMPQPDKIHTVEKDGQQFVIVTGKMPPFSSVTLPSARPCYVYDNRGKLVIWSSDPGDNSRFQSEWLPLKPLQTLANDKVIAWLENQ